MHKRILTLRPDISHSLSVDFILNEATVGERRLRLKFAADLKWNSLTRNRLEF